MFKTTFKNLAARKLRLALTATSVLLGVGFIAGTFVLTDTMNKAFDEVFTDVTSGIDVYVRASDFSAQDAGSDVPTVPEELLAQVQAVPGVDTAVGTVGGFAQFIDKDGDPVGTPGGAPTLGWNDASSGVTIRDGRAPASETEVVVDAKSAESNDFAIGDRVQVLLEGPIREFEIVGIAGFGEEDNLGGATLAVFDVDTAQEIFNKPDSFDSIEVAAENGIPVASLVADLGDVLPDGYDATSGTDVAAEQSESLKKELSFFTTALLVFAGVAVLVGSFIIFNTFSIVVAQRTREFALLKSLGASQRQVMSSVLLEAGVVGLVASIAGLFAGLGIAAGLKSLLSSFGVDLPSTDLQFLPRTVIVSLVVGMTVTIVASVIPARKAARVSPMAALRGAGSGVSRWSKKRTIVGVALMLLGGAFLLSGTLSGTAATAVGLGALAIFFGVTTLTPLFAAPLARWVGAPVARLFETPGKLAQENAARNPKRTAATAAALMIGLALVSLVSILGSSIKAQTERVLDDSVRADFIVKSGGAMMIGPGFPHGVAEEIAEVEGVDGIATLTRGEFRTGDQTADVAAIDARDFARVITDFEITSGDLAALDRGKALIEEATAERRSLKVGDRLPVEFAATGEKQLEVVGIYDDAEGIIGSPYAISNETYMRNFRAHMINIAMVQIAPTAKASDVAKSLETVTADYPNVEVQDQEAFIEEQATHIDELFALITALLGLALVIALFGITNTLALSVFERVKEIGLLRAVGMVRSQARAAIRWEAMIVSTIGALLGIVVGLFFGWSMVLSLKSEGITEFAVPWEKLMTYLVAAGIAGVIAALPPARRAARLNVLDAVAAE